ncbi:D-galacturonate reductase [Geosmithia morbida]|uniref:D-galacturonate reductase n=1 Tax=Geosmithia morbida TaxID=1094350 RepID=A0A9P4YPP9_9HYPO|nr:D-galacturonate reductase [Geosmithia morbida]KAF4120848.1 D-galacturonate reductase [Geosmithia morbida]
MSIPNVLMVGTGEYTTGFVGGGASNSDKKVGVVGLTLFDLRRRGKVGNLSMVGVNGTKFPAIRQHLDKNITQAYNGLDTSFDSFPENDVKDPDAYKAAIDKLKPGDAITVFTPDPSHHPIALYAIERGIHVLLTKPAVKELDHHQELIRRAREKNVYVFVEHHKRFDPAYSDARFRAQKLGDFNYFYSYMSQPKFQLETFKSWAGRESDISYYLNSHHVDVCDSMVQARGYVPVKVSASSSKGVAVDLGCVDETEDTISLLVTWVKKDAPAKRAIAVYTASWTAPQRAGVHTNQYFHYLGASGEIRVDQCKRGYDVADDEAGQLQWINPFYMRYAPDEDGNFQGQTGYGYVSIEKFIDGCRAINDGTATLESLDAKELPTLKNTLATTAILQAGRKSIDEGREVQIVIENGEWKLVPESGMPQYKDVIFPQEENAPALSELLGSLRRSNLSIHNRLASIYADSRFVLRCAHRLGGGSSTSDEGDAGERVKTKPTCRPLVANERCGSWYIPPASKQGSAYFKSTDGHERAWKFSTRRLNLHLVDLVELHDGIIVVDSTRRGKRMPDALSATVPIWCAVLNRVLLPSHPGSRRLFLPPYYHGSTHAQIEALIPGFVESLVALGLEMPTSLTKPMRPFWVTRDTAFGSEDGSPTGVIFEDYRPVVCCTASSRVVATTEAEGGGGYIQGAADDTENWAHGLTPDVFWSNLERLLSAEEDELPGIIGHLVETSRTDRLAGGGNPDTVRLTPHISVCTLPMPPGEDACRIALLPITTCQDTWIKTPRSMEVGLGKSKAASRALRLALPKVAEFVAAYVGAKGDDASPDILIACESGKDLSVGTALAISCYLFDQDGRMRRSEGGTAVTKSLVKTRLGAFMTAYPGGNPSRNTLQSVNSFLMDWRN